MKNLHPIHQSPEQRLASTSERAAVATESSLKKLEEVAKAVRGISLPSSAGTVRKLEEVKSAALATNLQLRRIEKLLEKEQNVTVKLTIV